MFYSHEVLTSRKYGVATVWLVATLGTASDQRKVKRAEIEGVDVSKACETITSTETPLALRLQSNLLFGVSRVYSQQCTFVLKDAEHVRLQVRLAMTALKTATTTTSTGRVAKVQAITLEDDPNFALETELIPGLDLEYEPYHVSQESRIFSLESEPQSRSSNRHLSGEHDIQPVHIYADDLPGQSEPFSVGSAGGTRSASAQPFGSHHASLPSQHEIPSGRLLEDPGFAFDMHGELVEGQPEERQTTAAVHQTPTVGIDGDHHRHLESASRRGGLSLLEDLDLPLYDDANMFLDVEPLSIKPRSERGSVGAQPQPAPTQPFDDENAPQHDDEDEEYEPEEQHAAAHSRAQRRPKLLTVDSHMELRNAEYVQWEQNYASIMQAALKAKFARRMPHFAKMNAQHWIEEGGALGLSMQLNIPSTLRLFTGQSLIQAFTRREDSLSPSSQKRSRSHSSNQDDEGHRRVRQRLFSEAGRADDTLESHDRDLSIPMIDDDPMALPGEGDDVTVEVGRQRETPLADHRSSSRMPWNISASIRGSSAARDHPALLYSGRGRGPSSSLAGGDDRAGLALAMSAGMRGSSIAAPSPLGNYPRPSTGDPGLPADDEDTFQLPVDDPVEYDEGITAGSAAQLARESQMSWLSGASDQDLQNFLAFVVDAIAEKREERGGDVPAGQEGHAVERVTFEELLPPDAHGKDVAAQGLMHILALHGRGVIEVQQECDIGFAPILIKAL